MRRGGNPRLIARLQGLTSPTSPARTEEVLCEGSRFSNMSDGGVSEKNEWVDWSTVWGDHSLFSDLTADILVDILVEDRCMERCRRDSEMGSI